MPHPVLVCVGGAFCFWRADWPAGLEDDLRTELRVERLARADSRGAVVVADGVVEGGASARRIESTRGAGGTCARDTRAGAGREADAGRSVVGAVGDVEEFRAK